MNRSSAHLPSRLHELLADRALQGLDPKQERELEQLLSLYSDVDEQQFERVVAEMDARLSMQTPDILPAALTTQLHQVAEQWSRSRIQPARNGQTTMQWRPVQQSTAVDSEQRRTPGWARWTAIAACLILGLLVWQLFFTADTSIAAKRWAMMSEVPDLMHSELTTADPVAARTKGDVVWSTSRQEGYLRFTGLEVNDPSQWQYQIWIVDASRPKEPPINGGIFDVIDSAGFTVIPIRPEARANDPRSFLVTIEQPGGVEVSSQRRSALFAIVSPSLCQ